MRTSLALLALVPATLAHFVLQWPTPNGDFDDDNESHEPCGGYAISANGSAPVTDVTVDSFAIALLTTHPQGQFLYRAIDSFDEPYNWTNLLPIVNETSQGNFCLPNLRAPSDFAGKQGVIQVIGNLPDGLLYQCAIVNFVTGSNTTTGADCKNATGLTATVTNQDNFTTSTSSGGSTSSSSHSAAMMTLQNTGLLASVFTVVGAVLAL